MSDQKESSLKPYLLFLGFSSLTLFWGYFSDKRRKKREHLSAVEEIEKDLQKADKRIHKMPEYKLPLDLIGRHVDQLPTPVLLLELEDYEYNLAQLEKTLYDAKCEKIKVRAHFKAHKCPQIAYHQVTYGSCVGVCCQKLSEAVALLESRHQVDDVFISNEIVDEDKLRRLVRLALLHPDGDKRNIKLSACVDNVEGKH